MNCLPLPRESGSRRKSTSDLYRGMNVSKALAILKISEREYRELTDSQFREAFTRRQTVIVMPTMNDEEVDGKSLKGKKSVPKKQNPKTTIEDQKMLIEKNMKMHEAFQFLVKKRSTTNERKLTRQETALSKFSLDRSESAQSWESQDLAGTLSDLCCSDVDSPAPKRRGSISPFLVGPGTPPPIDIPGLASDNHNGDDNQTDSQEPKDGSRISINKLIMNEEATIDEKKKKRYKHQHILL